MPFHFERFDPTYCILWAYILKVKRSAEFVLQPKQICRKSALILTPKLSAKKCVNYQNHMNVVSEGNFK